MKIIKTDEQSNTPAPVEQKPVMKPTQGGAGTITMKQAITTVVILIVLAVVFIVGIFLYTKYKPSPVKALPQ